MPGAVGRLRGGRRCGGGVVWGCYGVVVGLATRVTLMFWLWPLRTKVMLTLSPTLRSRTWATRDRDPSMELPSTAVIASPVWSPALSAGVPPATLVRTAAARLAVPSATTPSLEETPR